MRKKQKRRHLHAAQSHPSSPFFKASDDGNGFFSNTEENSPFIPGHNPNTVKHSEDLMSPQLSGNVRLENSYDNIQFIRFGSKGEHIERIQRGLVENGRPLPKFGIDGIFGSETLSAIKSYQQANGLVADGIVGEKTIGTLDRFYLTQLGIPIHLGLPNIPQQVFNQTSNLGSGALTLNTPGVVETASDPLMFRATPKVTAPSSANAIGKLGKGSRVDIMKRVNKQWLLVNANDMLSGMNKIGFVQAKFIREPTESISPTVNKIEAVTSSSKAISGYGAVAGDANLNKPGEFNNQKTGECKNVHQIHFSLDQGDAIQTQPERKAKGFFQHGTMKLDKEGGTNFKKAFPDGPIELEVRVPNKNEIVVADAPGVMFYTAFSDYPFKMELQFELFIRDQDGKKIASADFDVFIDKRAENDIPNTRNELILKEKKDLVRNKSL